MDAQLFKNEAIEVAKAVWQVTKVVARFSWKYGVLALKFAWKIVKVITPWLIMGLLAFLNGLLGGGGSSGGRRRGSSTNWVTYQQTVEKPSIYSK